CDPGLRHQIRIYSVNQRDDIRREYIKMRPYQPKLRDYQLTNDGMQEHRFQYHYQQWKKKCPFLQYEGGPSSHHNKNMQSWGCLRNPIQHIERLINAQTSQQLLENRLRLKTSIIVVKWLAKQACAFRGHDESVNSKNQGNFMELIKHSAECSKEIAQSDIQKELLNILANKMRNKIRKELGDGKFCILVAEALDESDKKQMAIILRYVDSLGSIVNVLTSSAKRRSELKSVWEAEIIDLIASGEVQTGTGANQIHTLERPGDTRWSSHFRSVSRLLDLFSVVRKVLGKLVECGSNNSIRGEAKGACESMTSFKFVFILHLLNKVLGVSDLLCQALQVKSQDILNVVHLVSTTKKLLQRLGDNGWETFIENVILFCEKNEIYMSDMKARHMKGRGRSCQQNNYIIVEHYYHYDIFNTLELLTLSSALNPIDAFKSFKIEDICSLAERFYPEDFTKIEFQNITSLSELCRKLVETRKLQIYFLLDRLIRLVLTLPVSTATIERAFSAMKLIKTTHRNKLENEFLSD
ncbi:hypothetical protein CISIN_1g038425mg, partial [Citrus sinensis]